MNMPKVSEVCLSVTERVPLCLSVWQCVFGVCVLATICLCLCETVSVCVLIMTEVFKSRF